MSDYEKLAELKRLHSETDYSNMSAVEKYRTIESRFEEAFPVMTMRGGLFPNMLWTDEDGPNSAPFQLKEDVLAEFHAQFEEAGLKGHGIENIHREAFYSGMSDAEVISAVCEKYSSGTIADQAGTLWELATMGLDNGIASEAIAGMRYSLSQQIMGGYHGGDVGSPMQLSQFWEKATGTRLSWRAMGAMALESMHNQMFSAEEEEREVQQYKEFREELNGLIDILIEATDPTKKPSAAPKAPDEASQKDAADMVKDGLVFAETEESEEAADLDFTGLNDREKLEKLQQLHANTDYTNMSDVEKYKLLNDRFEAAFSNLNALLSGIYSPVDGSLSEFGSYKDALSGQIMEQLQTQWNEMGMEGELSAGSMHKEAYYSGMSDQEILSAICEKYSGGTIADRAAMLRELQLVGLDNGVAGQALDAIRTSLMGQVRGSAIREAMLSYPQNSAEYSRLSTLIETTHISLGQFKATVERAAVGALRGSASENEQAKIDAFKAEFDRLMLGVDITEDENEKKKKLDAEGRAMSADEYRMEEYVRNARFGMNYRV